MNAMSNGVRTIGAWKNAICVINFALMIYLLGVEETDFVSPVVVFVGVVAGSLGPIFWNPWLYSELFGFGSRFRLVSLRAFLGFGVAMALSMTVVLLSMVAKHA